MAIVIAVALFFEIQRQKEAEAQQEAERQAVFEYETRIRSNLVRIYQNLKIEHYLAAYKNLEGVEVPHPRFVEIYREYHEVLYRIAKGLIESDFLNEAESLLLKLQAAREFEDRARESLIMVASRRRWKSAQSYVVEGKKYYSERRFRDAVQEYLKARAEYESVKLFKIHDVDGELAELGQLVREARYEISFGEAKSSLVEAQKSIEANFFREALDRVRKAGDMVARATYYGGKRSEVKEIRRKLVELEAELAYRVPNALPIQNLVEPAQFESAKHFFYLDSIKPEIGDPTKVNLQFSYRLRTTSDHPFVMRTKIYLQDGRFFYEGMKIFPEEGEDQNESHSGLMIVKIPENMRGARIKKIDVQVHDQYDKRYSFVQRAFRLAPPS